MDLVNADTTELSNIKTIRDYIKISNNREAYEKDIDDNLKYIKRELDYMEFDKEDLTKLIKDVSIL